MMQILRVCALAWRVHLAQPETPLDRVAVAAAAAVAVETDAIRAEVLVAIAAHESDLEPRAVSWRRPGGRRVDIVWTAEASPPPARGPMTCGLGQTVASTRDACAELLDATAGMRASAAELAEWWARSRGDLRRALAGYAGGERGFRAGRSPFGDLFLRRARALGMTWPTS